MAGCWSNLHRSKTHSSNIPSVLYRETLEQDRTLGRLKRKQNRGLVIILLQFNPRHYLKTLTRSGILEIIYRCFTMIRFGIVSVISWRETCWKNSSGTFSFCNPQTDTKIESENKLPELNGFKKPETYNQNSVSTNNTSVIETSDSYQEIIKYFR